MKKKFRSANEAKQARENQEAWKLLVKKYDVHKRDRAVAVEHLGFINPVVHREFIKIPDDLLQRLKRAPYLFVERKKMLNADMQAREEAAQKEIALKKQRVAPIANKMGLAYITEGMDLHTIGKKV